MAALKQVSGKNSGTVYELDEGTILIGRNPLRCQIVLENHAVSREHARIEVIRGQMFIEDLNSRNGVLVNANLLTTGPGGRTRIFHDDQIDIAGFRFMVDDEPSSTTSVELVAEETARGWDILSTVDISAEGQEWRVDESPAAKLRAVLNIINDLAHTIDLTSVLPKILDSLFRSFPQAERAFILLSDPLHGSLKPVASKRRDNRPGPIRSSRSIVDEAVKRKSAVLTGDALQDRRFADSESAYQLKLRSAMCAPFFDHREQVIGAIQLEVSDQTALFSPSELQVLAGVARHIGIVVENSRLHEAALRHQRSQFERRFQTLVEGSIQGIMVHRDLEPLFCNQAWADLHGYSLYEILDMDSILPLIAASDRPRLQQDSATVMSGLQLPHRYEYQGLRRDGTPIWLENLVTVVEWQDRPAVLSTVLDISNRKRAEEALRQTHEELEGRVAERTAELARERDVLRTLMDHLPDYVFIKDRDGRFVTTNRSHLRILQAESVDDVRQKTDFDFFPRAIAARFRRDEEAILKSGTPLVNQEEHLPTEGRREQWLLTTKAPWRDADGQIAGIVGIARDITTIKEAAEIREHYMAELEQFAAIAAHDLQEPLRAVGVFCDLLRRQLGESVDADSREMMSHIADGAKRMQDLIDALSTYSRITGNRRPCLPVDVNAVFDQAMANLIAAAADSGATVTKQILPTVTADAPQLMQVFQNLVANALKFRGTEPLRVEVGARELPDEWEFFVADNGIGIEPKNFEKIFQIFQRVEKSSDRPGTGIGLAICKKVVERHGGRIWLTSEFGKGSTFYFTLSKRAE